MNAMIPLPRARGRAHGASAQSGVGMVELLVAMLLGAVLVIGVMQMFTASRQTFRMQDSMALTQEGGAFAIDFIARDLVRAGASRELPEPTDTNTVFNWPTTIDGGLGANDELTIVYEPNQVGVTQYCNGENIADVTARNGNHYWVNANRQLMCQGMARAGNVFVAVGTAQVLVDNVESFQVQYGVDSDQEPTCDEDLFVAAPTLYVPASRVPEAVNRVRTICPTVGGEDMVEVYVIRSVRAALLLRTEGTTGSTVDPATTYNVLEQVVGQPDIDPADGRLRRLFTRTIGLRNTREVIP